MIKSLKPFCYNALSIFFSLIILKLHSSFAILEKSNKKYLALLISAYNFKGIVIAFTIVFPNYLASSVIKLVPFILFSIFSFYI